MRRKIIYFSLILFLFSCSENKIDKLDVFIGIWKIEGQEKFEFWEKQDKSKLVGGVYKIIDNERVISENLSIYEIDGKVILEAIVLNQNEGEPIKFTLNEEEKKCFSFENLSHDFPKKIQYNKISESKIEISIYGEEGKAFSYSQLKE
jgi:hypothetical protein